MVRLPAFEPMKQLPPRYAGSAVLKQIYDAVRSGVIPLIQEQLDEFEACSSFEHMPQWLLMRYCEYFNIDPNTDETTIRSMLAWRKTTIGGKYKLSDMLKALGFQSFHIVKNKDGSLTATLYTRKNLAGAFVQATDDDAAEFEQVFRQYGPAHLKVNTTIARTLTFGSTDEILFKNRILFGSEGS